MNTETVTAAPAMTPAQRQANRRTRVQRDLEAGNMARYQVESFRRIVERMAALDMVATLEPKLLDFDAPLQAWNEKLLADVRATQVERQKEALKETTRPKAAVSHDAQAPSSIKAPRKPRTKPVAPPTEPPTTGRRMSRKSRTRVVK